MGAINAVHLRGGPCDGEHPEPLPTTAFPESLTAITVMDHTAWVGHVYGVTAVTMVDDRGVVRVLDFQRTVHGDLVKGGALRGPSSWYEGRGPSSWYEGRAPARHRSR